MAETAPKPENQAANPKPTRARSETQAPSPNHLLKNSRDVFSAFRFLASLQIMPCRLANTHSETELDVKAYPLVGSILAPRRRIQGESENEQRARKMLLRMGSLPRFFRG